MLFIKRVKQNDIIEKDTWNDIQKDIQRKTYIEKYQQRNLHDEYK